MPDEEKDIDSGAVSVQEVDTTPIDSDPELEAMFKAGVHFGYSRSKRHPKMEPFIFGLRHNVEVFDLEKVRTNLSKALAFIAEIAKKGDILLFVGTKPAIQGVVEEAAQKIHMPFMTDRWIGGFLTNFSVIRKRMDYFEDLKRAKQSGDLAKYKKKEIIMKEKELLRLEHNFRGVVSLKKRPNIMFVIDPKEESTAVREAKRIRMPIIAISNNDVDPELADYVIPANDSARTSVGYILEKAVEAWEKGKAEQVSSAPETASEM